MHMLFSVIVPTFNRVNLLVGTLSSIKSQELDSSEYEVIVVDNGSSKDNRQKVGEIVRHYGEHIRYIFEPRQGLHWARHAGAKAAKGVILVYTDDDVIVDQNWLSELKHAYIEMGADCAGGRILIKWDRQPPEWVIPYEDVLGRLDYGPERRFLLPGSSINGGNFSILKARLFEIGGFNPDQVGEYLVGDGETGLCLKIHDRGWRMVWVPKAIVSHIQLVEKNGTIGDIKRRYWNNGVCKAYNYFHMHKASAIILSLKASYSLIKSFKEILVGNILRFLARPYHYYHHEVKAAFLEGEGLYYLRLIFDVELRKLASLENWIDLA
jgi:glycosyltransferase involved in cell wall biosynthesis